MTSAEDKKSHPEVKYICCNVKSFITCCSFKATVISGVVLVILTATAIAFGVIIPGSDDEDEPTTPSGVTTYPFTPSCEPFDYSQFRWFTCKNNPEKWYGISLAKANFQVATSLCASAPKNPEINPGKLFEARSETDDVCLFNAMKQQSVGKQLDVSIAAIAKQQYVWNITVDENMDLNDPNANFWRWCPNDVYASEKDCEGGHNMEYANGNTVWNNRLTGTDFNYHITYQQLEQEGYKTLQARIYSKVGGPHRRI